MRDVTIRRAEEADIDAIQHVGLLTWPPTYSFASANFVLRNLNQWWTEEAVRRTIVKNTTWVASDQNGNIIGTATLGTFNGDAVLWKLYVLPEHQGRGIGRALLDTAISELAPGEDLILEFVGGNDSARDFYLASGFVIETTESNDDGSTTVWCRLRR